MNVGGAWHTRETSKRRPPNSNSNANSNSNSTAYMPMTTFPCVCPASTYRTASGTSARV